MTKGHFYFLTDEYVKKYSSCGIMGNHEINDNETGGRPCFFAIQDDAHNDIFWMVPISSKIEKFQQILAYKLQKYPTYDGLEFGFVRGRQAAFLLQNICPVKAEHIEREYIDSNTNQPVIINNHTVLKNVTTKAKKLINLTKKGIKCTQTDALKIYNDLKG